MTPKTIKSCSNCEVQHTYVLLSLCVGRGGNCFVALLVRFGVCGVYDTERRRNTAPHPSPLSFKKAPGPWSLQKQRWG